MRSVPQQRIKSLLFIITILSLSLLLWLAFAWNPAVTLGADAPPTANTVAFPPDGLPLPAATTLALPPQHAHNANAAAAMTTNQGLREATPGEIWLRQPDLIALAPSISASSAEKSASPASDTLFGDPSYQITFTIAPTGYDANGQPSAGWPAEKADAIRHFLDLMFPVLYDLYGPPSVAYTVTLVHDQRFTGSAIFYPTLDEIRLGDSATYQLITHEMIHAWRNDRILSSNAEWQYDPTLSCFEEAFAHGGAYDAMTEFAHRYPDFGLTQNIYQSSNEWDYDFQNVPELSTTDFWSQSGGSQMHWVRYEMAAAGINKIQRQYPDFYRAFNQEYYARLNANPALTNSRSLIKEIVQTIAPTIEGWPANQWIDRQAIFACVATPGAKVWLYSQHYPYDEYFVFQRIHFYETFTNGSDWAWHDGSQWNYHQLNGATGQGKLLDWNGNLIWQRSLLISPTINPPAFRGYGWDDMNLTTQHSHLPWPGGEASSYVTDVLTLGLYSVEVELGKGEKTATTRLPRVLGTELRQARGVWGGVIGATGGQIFLNHRDLPAELPLPVTNNAFWGTRVWASISEDDLLNSRPGLIDVIYIDGAGNTYTDTRTIQWGSWNGNQAFLFDVAKMNFVSGTLPLPMPIQTALPTATPMPTVAPNNPGNNETPTATPTFIPTATFVPTAIAPEFRSVYEVFLPLVER